MKIIDSKAIALEKGRKHIKLRPKEYILVCYSNESQKLTDYVQQRTKKIIKS